MAEVQLRNVSKRWGGFVGVDDFDLTVVPGPAAARTRLKFSARRAIEGSVSWGRRVLGGAWPKCS